MSRLAAVTGATGFIGPHLVAALARNGWRVRLLVRRWTPLPSLAGVDAEIVWGDLADSAVLARLVDGADAVVHAAGLIKARTPEAFLAVNRDGTARLSAAAPRAFFLHLSSLAAREPDISPYAHSKGAAEEVVSGRSGPWCTVRAPAVYGPGDRETLAYFKMAKRGVALRPNRPDARVSLIHVEDLVEVLAATLDWPPARSIYEIDDGHYHGYCHWDMSVAVGAAFGRFVHSIPVPRTVLAPVASLNARRPSVQILTPEKVRELFHRDWIAHDRRLAAALGWTPRYNDLREGFAHTIAWYRDHHWL
jgi:nucleoside-diphosphate-sugar epimerase